MLSSDRCLFLRSSLDRAAWPSTCRRSFSACCSLSCKSSCNVSGMRDVRSSAAVLLQDILLHRMEHQCHCWASGCVSLPSTILCLQRWHEKLHTYRSLRKYLLSEGAQLGIGEQGVLSR